jgi:hypothetical protein
VIAVTLPTFGMQVNPFPDYFEKNCNNTLSRPHSLVCSAHFLRIITKILDQEPVMDIA